MVKGLIALLTLALASSVAFACPGDGYKAQKGAKPEASQPATPKPGSA